MKRKDIVAIQVFFHLIHGLDWRWAVFQRDFIAQKHLVSKTNIVHVVMEDGTRSQTLQGRTFIDCPSSAHPSVMQAIVSLGLMIICHQSRETECCKVSIICRSSMLVEVSQPQIDFSTLKAALQDLHYCTLGGSMGR